jgi:hypothetical protein
MSGKVTKVNVTSQIASVVAGLAKHYAGKTLSLDGVEVSAQEVADGLNACAAAITASANSKAVWRRDVATEATLKPAAVSRLVEIRTLVRLTFGNTSPVLSDFGMTPRTRAKPTAAVQSTAAQKSAATRIARHTLGPKQKAKIHGVVPTVPSPAPAEPATTAPAAAPATSPVKSS